MHCTTQETIYFLAHTMLQYEIEKRTYDEDPTVKKVHAYYSLKDTN